MLSSGFADKSEAEEVDEEHAEFHEAGEYPTGASEHSEKALDGGKTIRWKCSFGW